MQALCHAHLQVKSVNYPGSSLTVPKLKKGASYEFRVIAENVHGDSEPLVTDGPIKAENPFSKSTWCWLVGGISNVYQVWNSALFKDNIIIIRNAYRIDLQMGF